MGEIATIGLDLAKNVFQVHGIDARGKVLAGSGKNLGQTACLCRADRPG
jgi:hypothetical protein